MLRVHVDVGDETSLVNGIRRVIERFGRIDIAVNNAGVGGPIAASTDISTEQFRSVLEINTIGLWVSQREVLKQMLSQDRIKLSYGLYLTP